MNFKDIFEKYKNKTASEEEIKYVEDEIEKNSIINDYLNEQSQLDLDIPIDKEGEEELKNIKKSIRKRSSSLVFIAVVLVILLLTTYNIFSKPLLNQTFYNPMKRTYSDYSYDIDVCLDVINELHFPGLLNGGNIAIENTGVGDYNFTLIRNNMLTGTREYIPFTISKGKISSPYSFWAYPSINIFTRGTMPFYSFPTDMDKMKEYLKGLPDYINVKAYISFDYDLSMSELSDIFNNNKNIYFAWAGIRNSEEDIQKIPLIGFETAGSGIFYENINTIYPNFELSEEMRKNNKATGELYESHFKSLLNFQIDNEDFLKALKALGNNLDSDYYKSILDYVNKNGVKTYGVVAIGSASEILKFYENKYICGIYINDLSLNKTPK